MAESHYSLRWHNHQHHVLNKFSDLLRSQSFVDVTLYSENSFIRAHKIVLSACSPYFEKLFSDNPCHKTVVLLPNFTKWELEAIVKFIYDGEVSIAPEQLDKFMKAADTLSVRGLTSADSDENESAATMDADLKRSITPVIPQEYDNQQQQPFDSSVTPSINNSNGTNLPVPSVGGRIPPYPPPPSFEPPVISNHQQHHQHHHHHHQHRLSSLPPHMNPSEMTSRIESQSPTPRRKQARPRRRSGEIVGPQDLSTTHNHHHHHHHQHHNNNSSKNNNNISSSINNNNISINTSVPVKRPPQDDEVAENLCIKKTIKEMISPHATIRSLIGARSSPEISNSPDLDLSLAGGQHDLKNFSPNHSPSLSLPPSILSMHNEMDNHSALGFPPMPSMSALAMAPPHGKFFGLDSSPLGLFPPGLDVRNPLLELTDPRNTPDPHLFGKKKMGRPKGQHSAPRGGPPRSWTNTELTQALAQVWNKQMTTSQASRCYGIPYNSLLMYVRGKYGKSLKLEQLRKDCINGGGSHQDKTNSNNNNNMCKAEPRDATEAAMVAAAVVAQQNTRPSSREQLSPPLTQHIYPFHSLYTDFVGNFPMPVNLVHLMPQSENNRDHYGQLQKHHQQAVNHHSPQQSLQQSLSQQHQQSQQQPPPSQHMLEEDTNSIRGSIKSEEQDQQAHQDLYNKSRCSEERRDFQQNGQD